MSAVPTSPRIKLRSTSRRVPRTHAPGPAESSETDTEPTMRLSRAILVMFLLHVVAVGGFFASSLIKEHDLRRSVGTSASPLEAEDAVIATKPRATALENRRPDPSSPATTQSVHIVRAGETPMRIANDNGVSLAALVAANGSDIVTAGLKTGQELRLPEKVPAPAAQTPSATSKATSLNEGRARVSSTPVPVNASTNSKSAKPPTDTSKPYVVGKGENAYAIAQKFHVSYDALLKLNQIDDPKKLKPGQKLRMPASAKAK